MNPDHAVLWWSTLVLSGLALVQHWLLRLWNLKRFDLPLRFWWLMGAGGSTGGVDRSCFGLENTHRPRLDLEKVVPWPSDSREAVAACLFL